jgi:predicted Zn-dependent protease
VRPITLFVVLCTGCGGFIGNKQEVEIGQGVHKELRGEYKLVDHTDPVAKWAVEFVKPLETASAEFRDPKDIGGYKVSVISDDELLNAFAAPGGFTYLSTGLILAATSCAEIAGVMGHELAHVTERHGVKRVEGAYATEQLAGFFLDEGLAKDAAVTIYGLLSATKFSRDDEADADSVGLQISFGAGYDPHGLAEFFQKLLKGEDGGIEFLSSHPATDSRIKSVTNEIKKRFGPEAAKQSRDCRTTLSLEQVKARIKDGVKTASGTGTKKPE